MFQIGQLAHGARQSRQLWEAFGVLIQDRNPHLQRQIGNHGAKVSVAGPFADGIERDLGHARAGLHGRERVGDRQPEVVGTMDAELAIGGVADAGNERPDAGGVPTPTVSGRLIQSAPASSATAITSNRKSGSVRVASMGLNMQTFPDALT